MQTTYQPADIESHWTQAWEAAGYFKPSPSGTAYAIALPPPNVTGTLHMGHGFQISLMDALIRRARMQGQRTLWQPGTDHAGIATQMVVERQLAQTNQSRHDLGRDAFIKKVWDWREQSGSTITEQMHRLGASCDWSRQQFSMDDNITEATYTAFLRLYEDGLVYRGKRLVNWDPALQTAISDLEVENRPQQGSLWHIQYPLSNGQGHLTVATTRPETLFGDVAVAVHPEDERYRNLIGESLDLPLTSYQIPIIADAHVDPTFGSGCVKVTPAHDFNDYDIGQRHNLPMREIMQFDGHLNDQVPKPYQGMERFAARKQVAHDLEALGLLEKTEPHTNTTPYGDRSGVVIEPMLTDQWFVKADQLAKQAMAVTESGALTFIPSNWQKTYLQWLENIQDWCVSRQLWWGHRIPVWYDANNTPYVGMTEADARARHNLDNDIILTQDNDVFDTWFTAALWPFASLGWPHKTPELEAFYPTNVLVTGFDIIFFWVARMVMMGLYCLGDVPFKHVYITGLIRDAQGQKMSKSKGNVLDPIDLVDGITLDALIDKRTQSMMQPQLAKKIAKQTRKDFPDGIAAYGTDALRFTFCALASTGRDINFDLGRIEGYRNFCNKIWNAARFVLMNVSDIDHIDAPTANQLSIADQWIIGQLQMAIETTNKHFDQYRFDLAAQTLYEFVWNHYCDWYLELAKLTLNNDHASLDAKRATQYTLLHVLEQTLRLLHPIMPFITEEIWQTIAPKLMSTPAPSIMVTEYPRADLDHISKTVDTTMSWLFSMIGSIRNLRSEMQVSPAKSIPLLLSKGTQLDRERIEAHQSMLFKLAKIESAQWVGSDQMPVTTSDVIGELELHIPLAGLIDKSAELERTKKEIEKLSKTQHQCEQKLGNQQYIDRAPADVVEKEREKLAECQSKIETLQAHYQRIERL